MVMVTVDIGQYEVRGSVWQTSLWQEHRVRTMVTAITGGGGLRKSAIKRTEIMAGAVDAVIEMMERVLSLMVIDSLVEAWEAVVYKLL